MTDEYTPNGCGWNGFGLNQRKSGHWSIFLKPFAFIQSDLFLDVCWFATSATFLYRRWSLALNLIWGSNLCIGLQWLGSKACKRSISERTLVDCHGKVQTGSGTAFLEVIFKRKFTVLSVDSTGSDSIKNVARSNNFLRRSSSNTFKDLGTIGIAPISPRKQCGKMTTGSCSLSSEHHCWMWCESLISNMSY